MNRDIDARLLLIRIQNIADLLHGLIMPRIRRPQNHKHPNGILIDILLHKLGIQPKIALLTNRQNPRLDLEIPCKFLQRHLCVGSHDDIRFTRVFAFCHPLLLPAALHS